MKVDIEFEMLNGDIADSLKAMPQIQGFRLAGTVALAIMLARFVLAGTNGALVSQMPSLLFLGAIGACFLLTPYLASRQALKNFTDDERRVKMRFGDDGFQFESGKGQSTIHWQAVHRVIESKHGFLFFISNHVAHFLPARLLSVEDVTSIRTLVKDKVTPRKAPGRLMYALVIGIVVVVGIVVIYQVIVTKAG